MESIAIMDTQDTPKQKPTIRELRMARNWTQQDLAYHADLTIPAISRLENGHPVNKTTLRLICVALGVEPDDVSGVTVSHRPGKRIDRNV